MDRVEHHVQREHIPMSEYEDTLQYTPVLLPKIEPILGN